MIRKLVNTAVQLDTRTLPAGYTEIKYQSGHNDSVKLDKKYALESTLVGWHKFIHEIFALEYALPNLNITGIKIDKGLLRFYCSTVHLGPFEKSIFDRVAQSIAKDSALCCIVCGQRGNRRKLEMGWPCLCKTHYIEYANDEEGTEGL